MTVSSSFVHILLELRVACVMSPQSRFRNSLSAARAAMQMQPFVVALCLSDRARVFSPPPPAPPMQRRGQQPANCHTSTPLHSPFFSIFTIQRHALGLQKAEERPSLVVPAPCFTLGRGRNAKLSPPTALFGAAPLPAPADAWRRRGVGVGGGCIFMRRMCISGRKQRCER